MQQKMSTIFTIYITVVAPPVKYKRWILGRWAGPAFRPGMLSHIHVPDKITAVALTPMFLEIVLRIQSSRNRLINHTLVL